MTYLRDKSQVSRYLDPAVVGKLENLELKARDEVTVRHKFQ